MRYRKPKKNKSVHSALSAVDSPDAVAPIAVEPAIPITADEARVLGLIRKDVLWSVGVLVVLVGAFVAVSMTVARGDRWAPLAEQIARAAGLIK